MSQIFQGPFVNDCIGIKKRIRVIHRLDQPTSGVVIFATNRAAARKLREDFEKRRVKKDTSPWFMDIPPKKNGLARFP